MKKLCAVLLTVSLLLMLAACGGSGSAAPASPTPAPAAETPAPAAETPAHAAETPAPAPETPAPTAETPAPVPETPEPEETGELEPEIQVTWEEEIPAEELTGRWYCRVGETDLVLELQQDGTYTVTLPGVPEESVSGLWRLEEGLIWLDEEELAIAVREDGLYWYALEALATREAPEPLYVPGEPVLNLAPGAWDGYWVTEYLDVDGQIFTAEELGEALDLYLEGRRAALGGFFGDQIVDLEEAEGTLGFAGEGFRVSFTLLDDGFLRMTLSGDFEGELVYYLLPLMLKNAELTED